VNTKEHYSADKKHMVYSTHQEGKAKLSSTHHAVSMHTQLHH